MALPATLPRIALYTPYCVLPGNVFARAYIQLRFEDSVYRSIIVTAQKDEAPDYVPRYVAGFSDFLVIRGWDGGMLRGDVYRVVDSWVASSSVQRQPWSQLMLSFLLNSENLGATLLVNNTGIALASESPEPVMPVAMVP